MFTWEAKWTQTCMRFHFGSKSHFGVRSALYLCSHDLRWNETENSMDFISVILTEMKFQTSRFSCEHNLPKIKWISIDLLDVVFNAHVCLKLMQVWISYWSFWQKWNFSSVDKISSKHYPKRNAYTCPSKYWVVLKCSRNETSYEQLVFTSVWNLKPVWTHFASHVNAL